MLHGTFFLWTKRILSSPHFFCMEKYALIIVSSFSFTASTSRYLILYIL